MGRKGMNIFNKGGWYKKTPVNETDNAGLFGVVNALEWIYTTTDWPFKEVSMNASLQQLGKSRADLWQFAGLIALERALERANRACDLDKWTRQQVEFGITSQLDHNRSHVLFYRLPLLMAETCVRSRFRPL